MSTIPETDRVPPALLAHLRYVFSYYDPVEPSELFLRDFERVVAKGSSWWSNAPELEALGHRWVSRANHPEMRRRGCIWLRLFPSREMARALATIALSRDEPRPIRNQAVCSLGFRQIQDRNDALLWDAETTALADAALVEVSKEPNARDNFDELSLALRHSLSPELLAHFASDPVAWSKSIECFANAPLARALLHRLPEIASDDIHRVVRLVADTLGAEACTPLLAFAAHAPFTERAEALLAALAVDPTRARPHVDAMLASMNDRASFEGRARWHEANPGVFPTVRALRIARTTATQDIDSRTAACREASDLFASQARIALFAERYLYTMWRHTALRSRDPQRVAALVDAHPQALDDDGVLEPYLEALADQGRFRKLLAEARRAESGALPAWLLATRGRPFLALAARSNDRSASSMGVAAQALALFLAGRPDLSRRTLVDESPRTAIVAGTDTPSTFPGPDEVWRMKHDRTASAPMRALVDGFHGLLACARGAPDGADPDTFDLELLATFERSLARDLAGATVFLAGDHRARLELEATLSELGARLARGPFAGIDFFICGENVPIELVARLERQGARRIDAPPSVEVQP